MEARCGSLRAGTQVATAHAFRSRQERSKLIKEASDCPGGESEPERHDDTNGVRPGLRADQDRAERVFEFEHDLIRLERRKRLQRVAGVHADFERLSGVLDRELFLGLAELARGARQVRVPGPSGSRTGRVLDSARIDTRRRPSLSACRGTLSVIRCLDGITCRARKVSRVPVHPYRGGRGTARVQARSGRGGGAEKGCSVNRAFVRTMLRRPARIGSRA